MTNLNVTPTVSTVETIPARAKIAKRNKTIKVVKPAGIYKPNVNISPVMYEIIQYLEHDHRCSCETFTPKFKITHKPKFLNDKYDIPIIEEFLTIYTRNYLKIEIVLSFDDNGLIIPCCEINYLGSTKVSNEYFYLWDSKINSVLNCAIKGELNDINDIDERPIDTAVITPDIYTLFEVSIINTETPAYNNICNWL